MDKKQFLLYYLMPITVYLILVGLAYAVSPPPVDQKMGVYDTLFSNIAENNCRGCHALGVPGAHHNLVPTGEYGCTNCHPVLTNGSGITLIRDCIQCHDTTFNGIVIRRPHHETQAAIDGHCKTCHGSLVDNYDDGHTIPTYAPSIMTPDTKFKVINQTSGRKWGGCESCHEENATASPPIAFNNKTHHRLGNLSGFRNQDVSKCSMCHDTHDGVYGSDSIRYCERCHGTASLHNIQWDFGNTSQLTGYGHLGPNDCQGCHAWYVAGSLGPGFDLIVPTIGSLSTNKVFEGSDTVLTIYGDDLVTTIDNVTRSSVVVVSDGTNNVTITPTSITPSEIVVSIPALDRGLYSIYALKDGNIESNKKPVVSVPKVIISSARKVNSTNVLITGSGFGTYDPAYNNWTNVTIKRGSTIRSLQIISWSDTSINVLSTSTRTGDTATINSVYGTNSSTVTN